MGHLLGARSPPLLTKPEDEIFLRPRVSHQRVWVYSHSQYCQEDSNSTIVPHDDSGLAITYNLLGARPTDEFARGRSDSCSKV